MTETEACFNITERSSNTEYRCENISVISVCVCVCGGWGGGGDI